LQPQGGDDAHMVWRRRLVDEILSSNYPLQIAGDLLDQHVYTAGVLSALNRDVGRNTLQIMNYPDVHPRGTTLNALWERRRIAVTERLAASFYDTLKAILAPRPDERVALATLWSGGDDEVLKDLGTSFKTEPRAAAAVDVTSTGLDPADYADGSSGDPIPFLFYKRPSQYPTAIEPKANSHEPALAWNVENTLTLYDGTTAKIGGAGIFNPIKMGRHLQDNSGHGSNRPVEQKIRKSLALNYLLTGLDIDHILDLGFGGADVGKNLWPLNADVNRRPVNGQWRTQYKLHFKAGTQVFLGAIGSTNLYHKHYVIKGYVPGDGANGVPAESGTPAAGKKT